MNKTVKVVFLDRDGVINVYPGEKQYVHNIREFRFIPGSIEGIRKLNEKGFEVFVISNQAGIAKGLYRLNDLKKMDQKLLRELKKSGAKLAGIYYCTHHPQDECGCRKPKTGLLKQAVADNNIEPEVAFFIGDSFRDLKAGISFGARPVLVLSGKEKISNRSNWEFEPDYVFDNLLVAAHYLCAHYG